MTEYGQIPPFTFTGNRFDRIGHRRGDADWLAARLADATSRFLPMHGLKGLIDLDAAPCLGWRGAVDIAPFLDAGAHLVLLGEADFACHFAVDVSGIEDPKAAPYSDWGKFIDVRSIAPSLRPGEAGALAQARSMLDWHARHGFCANCGSPTQPREAGYSRKCVDEACGATHFPRTDPVVIMMVTDGERCLLGRGALFPKGSYSCLAGFIEPGETVEQAVRREVMEEAGIDVGTVRYHTSQPWPFPSSLMLGCFAEAASKEIRLDEMELEDARWFPRHEVKEMLARSLDPQAVEKELIRTAPPLAIAHQLVKAWLRQD